jgi:peptidoglycan/xylan/chitin deacetylase (PgdA/CDA1 family)
VFRFDLRGALSRVARRWLGQLCQLVPVWLWCRVFPEPALCLCYHMVSDSQVPHVKHYRFPGAADFERDLSDLEDRFGYLSYEQIIERRSRAKSSPETSVCLTFDDGFAECFSVVRPILLRHRATCIFFIITDLIENRAVFLETRASLCVDAILRRPVPMIESFVCELGLQPKISIAESGHLGSVPVQMARQWEQFEPRLRPLLIWLLTIRPADAELLDQLCQRLDVDAAGYVDRVKPYLSREQILQLQSDGFTIGAHSCSHRRLQELPLAEAEREIVESCRVIHDLTGQASVPFAFPYFGGGLDRFWLAKIRKQHPFIGLFFDSQGLRRDAPFVVQRAFGDRFEETGSIDRLLRRAWVRRLS